MTETTPRTALDWLRAGIQHYQAGRLTDAEAATRQALRLEPEDRSALSNLGVILRAQRRAVEALDVLDAALRVTPGNPDVLLNRANTLNELRRWPEALDAANQALAAAPDEPFAHTALGNALAGLGQDRQAVESFRESLRLRPDNSKARFNLATTFLRLEDPDQALALYETAIAANPGNAEAHAERGHILTGLGRWGEAAESLDRAFGLNPDLPQVAGARMYARMKICDWRDFDQGVDDLRRRINAGLPAALPFSTVVLPIAAREQLHCATTHSRRSFPVLPRPPAPPASSRIRIGYFSSDFYDHATAYLIAEVFELHDRDHFETTVFSFGRAGPNAMRRRIEAACEHFVDVAAMDASAIARLAVSRGIDIAVDLKGFTRDSRPMIFASGAAPIQVSYLGYPMSTGAPFMDYIIADRVLIGPQDRDAYSEKVAYLPGCYQPNDRQRQISPEATTRRDHGLPPEGFVFAGFNTPYKITPEVFAIWMDLLKATPGSVLWLLQDGAMAADNLRRAAVPAGVDPTRLVFAPAQPLARHLERIRHADLFVDTFPCSAHTTASDAIWAGLPLLTCKGETFAGRVAASVLISAGLPELIVDSLEDYRAMALGLAQDPKRLAALRTRTADARASPLFDTPTYVRALEDLYRQMHAGRLAGLAPDHIS